MPSRVLALFVVSCVGFASTAWAFGKKSDPSPPAVERDPPDASSCVSLPEELAGKQVFIANLYDDGVLMSKSRGHLMQGNGEPVVVFQFTMQNDTSQRWKLEPVEGGFYKILNHWDNRALSTAHNSADAAYVGNGEPLILHDYYGDPTQHWCLQGCFPDTTSSAAQDREGECQGVVIRNAYDGRALATLHLAGDAARTDPREPVVLNPASDDPTRTWRVFWWVGPSAFQFAPTKVEVYTDAGCREGKWELSAERYDYHLFERAGINDDLASVRVPERWSITFYENAGLLGASKTVTAPDDPRLCVPLGDFADRTSSMLVEQRFADEHYLAQETCDARSPRFAWSCDGHEPEFEAGWWCTQITEPSDPHTWNDNYFCARSNIGMSWSPMGPIAGMKCTQINEAAEPTEHYWPDNFLCLPESSQWTFTWSSAGPIDGKSCVQWSEPADPHTWNDNFLCWNE